MDAVRSGGAFAPATRTERELRLAALRAFVGSRHGGTCTAEHYRGQAARYPFRCADGHDFLASASNVLHRDSWCPVCAGNAPVGIERVAAHAASRGGRVLDATRVASRDTPVRIECARGHRFSIRPRDCGIGIRAWCPECLATERPEALLAALAATAAAVGHALESETWAGAREALDFRCPVGHRWRTTPERFRSRGAACPACRDAAKSPAPPSPTASTSARARRLLEALDLLLALPRVDRESPINAGQLRLLVLLDGDATDAAGIAGGADVPGADRHRARRLDGHDKPTVDARLAYLRAKGLVHPAPTAHYHDAAPHRPTPTGRYATVHLLGGRSRSALVAALDRICALPIGRRETPANVAHLAVLAGLVAEPDATLAALVGNARRGTKPAVRSRLQWLGARDLVERLPRFNAGGKSNPNRYRATCAGRCLIESLAPGSMPIPSTVGVGAPSASSSRGHVRATDAGGGRAHELAPPAPVRFRPVEGFEGRYLVGEDGRVLDRGASRGPGPDGDRDEQRDDARGDGRDGCVEPTGTALEQRIGTDGVHRVRLVRPRGRRVPRDVGVLVATAFVARPPETDLVRHLDGDPDHLHASNLAWSARPRGRHAPLRYRLVDPAGGLHEDTNLARLCRRHRLDHPAMREVVRGTARSHRGWTAAAPAEASGTATRASADEAPADDSVPVPDYGGRYRISPDGRVIRMVDRIGRWYPGAPSDPVPVRIDRFERAHVELVDPATGSRHLHPVARLLERSGLAAAPPPRPASADAWSTARAGNRRPRRAD